VDFLWGVQKGEYLYSFFFIFFLFFFYFFNSIFADNFRATNRLVYESVNGKETINETVGGLAKTLGNSNKKLKKKKKLIKIN